MKEEKIERVIIKEREEERDKILNIGSMIVRGRGV